MDDLQLRAILAGATEDEVNAIGLAIDTGTILNPVICPVVDLDGNPLDTGKVYQFSNGKKFRPTRWQFGSGNYMDTWFWVWGVGDDLKDTRITVDAKWIRVDGNPRRIYQAQLRLVEES